MIIGVGWEACARALAEAFRGAATVSMEFSCEDQPYLEFEPPSREYWSAPEPMSGDTSAFEMSADTGWSVSWDYSLGMLEAGAYDLHFLWTTSHPLPDGGDYDGDGHIDVAGGDTFAVDRDITIYVVE